MFPFEIISALSNLVRKCGPANKVYLKISTIFFVLARATSGLPNRVTISAFSVYVEFPQRFLSNVHDSIRRLYQVCLPELSRSLE